MLITANTRWPAIGRSLYELTEYFEMVFLKIFYGRFSQSRSHIAEYFVGENF